MILVSENVNREYTSHAYLGKCELDAKMFLWLIIKADSRNSAAGILVKFQRHNKTQTSFSSLQTYIQSNVPGIMSIMNKAETKYVSI